MTKYHPNGNINEQKFIVNGSLSRPAEDGPALQEWSESGDLRRREHIEDNQLHRPIDQGPAREAWDLDGRCIIKEYYLRGVRYTADGNAYDAPYG
jgi:hypothetical protein